jgi:hypothetical protein
MQWMIQRGAYDSIKATGFMYGTDAGPLVKIICITCTSPKTKSYKKVIPFAFFSLLCFISFWL